MKVKKPNLTATALAVAIATGATGLSVAPSAQAEFSATVGAANMYLWRGQNLTKDGAQVFGSLDYTNGGFYLGAWASTETGGEETDLYVGYGGAIGEFSYGISYWKYLYPEDCSGTPTTCALGDNDASEAVVTLGYGPVHASAYIAVESGKDDDIYYTIDGSLGKFTLLYGWWSLENPGNEYSHITLSYAATDELKFAVSVLSNDSGYTPETGAPAENPLFMVSYSKKFDLK